jgi:hypothetical protein
VCHKGTRWVRWATLVAAGWTVVWGQTATNAPAPKWRQIGNDAVDIALAAPATGPVDAVWYSADGTRLYARARSGRVFETVDFEHWTASLIAPAPPAEAPATVQRAPAPNVRLVAAQTDPMRVFALGQHVFRSDDGGKSWANLTAFHTESIIGPGQHSLAISKSDPDQIVVANDYGVWRSMDGGLSWNGLNQGHTSPTQSSYQRWSW